MLVRWPIASHNRGRPAENAPPTLRTKVYAFPVMLLSLILPMDTGHFYLIELIVHYEKRSAIKD